MSDNTQSSAPAEVSESSQVESSGLESQVEGSEGGEATETAATTAEAAAKEARRVRSLKLKVDGREFDEELPFEIEEDPEILEYLTKNLQMLILKNPLSNLSAKSLRWN
ncbi:hypothetical protein EBZ38_05915 [bacterium]|nr:hypothetical protein [bacterium]